ncbi:MAG TPA: sialidase family protein, partial [Bryobacteraceae bacterium]|nr:sialidase family protein [Bryobacteraceae bacterium]
MSQLGAQDSTSPAIFSRNSISDLVAGKPPQLPSGYPSSGDEWMLRDWRFDLLSNGAQQFLLAKYGYLDLVANGLDSGDQSDSPVAKRWLASASAAAPAPGANIPVSQAFFRVGRRLQSETTIAVNGANILVGFNDGDLRFQAVAFSKDSGATWSGGRLPSYPGVVGNAGDPVLAVAPGGRVYHAYLAPNAVGFETVALAYSDDGGATWNGPVNATASLGGSGSSIDKPWLAVDNMPGSPYRGSIYVTCTRFVPSGQDSISFMRSTDGGKTFSNAVALGQISAAEAAAVQDVQGS